MNKTKILSLCRSLGMMVVVLLFACCSGKKDKYCSAIPKDAAVLYRIDAYSFVDKHNIDLKSMKSMLFGKDDLDGIGIDLKKPFYGFVKMNGGTGMVAAIEDADAFTKFVNTYSVLIGAKVSEKQGLHWVESNGMYVAYDDTHLLMMSGDGMYVRKNITELMAQQEEESAMQTPLFERLTNVKEPFAAVISSNSIPEKLLKAELASGKTMEDFDMDIDISFDVVKDKALMACEVFPNSDKLKKNIEEAMSKSKTIEGQYINTIQEKPFLWGAFNADYSQYMDELEKQLTDMLKLSVGPDEDALMKVIVETLAKFVGTLSGDLSVCIPDAQTGNFIVQANVKDASAINEVFENLKTLIASNENAAKFLTIAAADKNNYTIVADGKTFLSGVKGNDYFFTNSTDYKQKVGSEVETGLEALKSEICSSYAYMTLDAHHLVGQLMQVPDFRQTAGLFMGRLANLDRVTLKFPSVTRAELSLSVMDGKDFCEVMFK